jgi:hypothetical protein
MTSFSGEKEKEPSLLLLLLLLYRFISMPHE